jgi:MFS family permease
MAPPLRTRLSTTYHRYPRQLWLMFFGLLLSRIGTSMIWPYLTIYVSEKVDLPLAAAASLLSINAVAGIVSSFIAGPIVDRVGRKWMMVAGLGLHGLTYIALANATTYPQFVVLMIIAGALTPLYVVGSDAMLADLVPESQRTDAYALLRLSANAGIAIGPMVGGIIATTSYSLAFYLAALGMTAYALLLAFFARETLPHRKDPTIAPPPREPLGGYLAILKDSRFMKFLVLVTLGILPGVMMWTLMPVYAKQNYGVQESLYGFIPTTNALMVVFLQLPVTMITKRYRNRLMMSLGAALYAVGAGIVSLAAGFFGFWLAMVVMSFGELVLVPTSSSYASILAPADKRGRYMSLYGLTWSVAVGIGPILGGLLNDQVSPQSMWIGGLLIGLVGAGGFLLQALRNPPMRPAVGT